MFPMDAAGNFHHVLMQNATPFMSPSAWPQRASRSVPMQDVTNDQRAAHAAPEVQPLIAAFAALLLDARRHRATDIHLEPLNGPAPLRYRVDGALRDVPPPAQ